jgi:glycosyltransferase involved in cell wall biosynthesis
VSDWIREQALASGMIDGERVITIHNPLDTDHFKPLEVKDDPYGTKGKKVILFGADKATSNTTKGFSYLVEALKEMDGSRYCAICFGAADERSRVSLDNIDLIYTGSINNDDELIRLYNLADVMVTPSIQEAFGYTCLEALSCGTPVTAFDTSGLKDQIIHKENGYLARLGNPHDLAGGIKFCIDNRERLSPKARERAVTLSGYPVVGAKYRELLSS